MMKITGKVENELDSTLVATPIAKTVASQNAEQQQVSWNKFSNGIFFIRIITSKVNSDKIKLYLDYII